MIFLVYNSNALLNYNNTPNLFSTQRTNAGKSSEIVFPFRMVVRMMDIIFVDFNDYHFFFHQFELNRSRAPNSE